MEDFNSINENDVDTSSSEADISDKTTMDNTINLKICPPTPNNFSDRLKRLTERREEISAFSNWKLQKFEEKKIANLNKRDNKVKKLKKINNQKEVLVGQEREWKDLRDNYLDVNKHLACAVDHKESKSGLEDEIKEAISKGEFEKAEQLSDQLSNRDFGVRINKAFAAKAYSETKAIEKDILKRKRAAKPYWGFQTKQRWEMKGNM